VSDINAGIIIEDGAYFRAASILSGEWQGGRAASYARGEGPRVMVAGGS
jgi:hypothetical protein